MTHLLTLVTAGQVNLAGFGAGKSLAMAKLVGLEFLAAVTETSNSFEAGWTVARVTLHGTGMVTVQLLAAGFVAGGRRHAALNRRV